MPGLYLPFAQRLFSDHDEVGRVAQRDLCDRVGFDDLQALLRTRAMAELVRALSSAHFLLFFGETFDGGMPYLSSSERGAK